MKLFSHFRAIDEKDKAALVRRLIENSTPDFDFFYISGLAIVMATLGLLLDSPSIVIGSMLLAPIMFPILGIALGMVMSNADVLGRSMTTLVKTFAIGLLIATATAFFFSDGGSFQTPEVLRRTDPNHVYFLVSIIAGAAVSYILARPEWSVTLPGIAISVALIPPLGTMGIGFAALDPAIIRSSAVLLFLNVIGIITAAAAVFMLMNLYRKQDIARSTIKREDERLEEQAAVIDEIENSNTRKHEHHNKTSH